MSALLMAEVGRTASVGSGGWIGSVWWVYLINNPPMCLLGVTHYIASGDNLIGVLISLGRKSDIFHIITKRAARLKTARFPASNILHYNV